MPTDGPGREVRGGFLTIDGDAWIPGANMTKGTWIIRGQVHDMLPTFSFEREEGKCVCTMGMLSGEERGDKDHAVRKVYPDTHFIQRIGRKN
ncbi:MAG: hypothetical protein V1862_09175, partial [Methanobacteriota archaeon]